METVTTKICANCSKNILYNENKENRLFSACLQPLKLNISSEKCTKTKSSPIESSNIDKESDDFGVDDVDSQSQEDQNLAQQLPIKYLEQITTELDTDSLQPSFVLVNHEADEVDHSPLSMKLNVNTIKSEYFHSSTSSTDEIVANPKEEDSGDENLESTLPTITILEALYEIYHFQWRSRMDLKRLTKNRKDKLCLCNDCSSTLSHLYHWFTKFKSESIGSENKAYLYPIVGDNSHFINLRQNDDDDKENVESNALCAELKECFVPIIKTENLKDNASGRRKLKRNVKIKKKLKLGPESMTEDEFDAEIRNEPTLPFECNACTKSFTSSRGLKLHQTMIHTESKEQSTSACPNCDQSFTSIPQFKKHVFSCTTSNHEEILPDLGTSNSELEGDTTDYKTGPSDTEGDLELDVQVSDDDEYKPKKQNRRSRTARNLSTGKLALKSGPVDCKICSKTFKNRALFRSHRRTHTTIHNCDYCPETFSDKASRRIHLNLAHEAEKSYICSLCSKSFFTAQLLKKHSANHEQKTVFSCSICERKFEHETQFKAHQLTHSTEEKIPRYKCKTCSKKYPSFHLLNSHIKYIHEKRNDFQCQECGKTFGTVSYLNAHLVSHSTTGTHLCDICGLNYKHKKDLRIHEIRFHSSGVNRSPHQCPICPKSYYRADHLRIHQVKKNHFMGGEPPEVPAPAQEILPDANFLAGKPFKCELCCKEYRTELALKTHEITHSELPEVPRYPCGQCGQKYLNLKALDYHVKYMHRLKSSHVCNTCNKTFGRYSSLKRHQQTHDEAPTHNCEECGKTYRNKLDLILHFKREHIGESSFDHECQVCGQKFYRKDMLRNHQVRTGHLQVPAQYIMTMITTTDGSEVEVQSQDTIEIEAHELLGPGEADIETQEIILETDIQEEQPLDTSDLQVFMVTEMEM